MATHNVDHAAVRRIVADAVLGPNFRRATFGGATRGGGSFPWVRVVVRPVDVRGESQLQFSYFDATRDVTKNYPRREAETPLGEAIDAGFAGVHVTTEVEEIDVRTSRKGKVHVGRRKATAEVTPPASAHNRVKDVPLPEGRADGLLEALGVLTRDGTVRPTMRAKFTQINELLKHLDHVLDDAGLRSLGRPVEILDCGCGSSHLTLSVHHFFNNVRGVPARITGVDVNEELIRKAAGRADKLEANGVTFACGPITAVEAKPDVVLALHACDTATDDALARAVAGEARLLLSVPCCHQHLNQSLKADGPAAVLRPILRHGILRQRAADLATDAFRALALRVMGYRTDVVEFVSPEHTARNLLIRAVRGAPVGERTFVDEYRELRRFWGVTPYIEGVLGEPFRRLVADPD